MDLVDASGSIRGERHPERGGRRPARFTRNPGQIRAERYHTSFGEGGLGPPAASGSGDGSLRRLYLIRDGQGGTAMIEPAAALGPKSPGPPPAAGRKDVGRPATPTKGGR
jgi:hypothetical protein